MVNRVYHSGAVEFLSRVSILRGMNTHPATPNVEVVTMPIGNGWRLRIADGCRLQFVSGFEAKSEAKSDAEQWAHTAAHAWLTKLRTIVEHL